jgi:iron(III) transport system substrate-binding protein
VKLVPGNGPAMRQVRDTRNGVAWCLTDTDDARIAIEGGAPVSVVYPDQAPGRPGAVMLPNTVALVAGAPHPDAAARLMGYLLSPEVERRLALGPSAQIPLRPGVEAPPHVLRPGPEFVVGRQFRAMEVDWDAVAARLDTWKDFLTGLFVTPK